MKKVPTGGACAELAKVSSGIQPILLAPISLVLGGLWSGFCAAHFLAADPSPCFSVLGILCFLGNLWVDFPTDTDTEIRLKRPELVLLMTFRPQAAQSL